MTDDQQRARELLAAEFTKSGMPKTAKHCLEAVNFVGYRQSVAAVVAALRESNQDKARLDWLADRNNQIGNVQLPTMCVMNNMQDMRAAIDEAMQIDPEAWGEVGAADDGEVASDEVAARPQGVKDA